MSTTQIFITILAICYILTGCGCSSMQYSQNQEEYRDALARDKILTDMIEIAGDIFIQSHSH